MSDAVLDRASVSEKVPAPTRRPVKFPHNDGFMTRLRERVDTYFEETGKNQRDSPRMYLKTATIFAWLIGSYVALVFYATTWWQVVALSVSIGFAMAAVGFNIQHDGSHGAYSHSSVINKLMAMTLDCLGGSSYIWKWKHNVIHHSFTNITGHDDDIELGTLGRLSPEQPRYSMHRFQHWYLWFLYGFIAIKWQFFDDFKNVADGKIGTYKIPRPKGWELVILFGGKIVFFTLAFVVPMLFHPWYLVLGVYALTSFMQGVVLSVVFQLAHCVEEAQFPMPEEESGLIENEWAIHQVITTVDFARGNRLVSWFTGGLNFQIEHHLFPRIAHVHYPALSKIVEQTCREFEVPFSAHETFRGAVVSHFCWLRKMGQPNGSPA